MSDKQHDLDQDPVGHEDHELQGEGVQAETWQEDQPPVDDFHDQAETETAAADVEEIEEPVEETPATSKSGMKVMVGALGVGAVLIGGLLYLQFGTSATPTPLAMPIAQVMNVNQPMTPPAKSVAPLPPPSAAIPSTDTNTVDPDTTPKTAEADMAHIYAAGHTNAADRDNAVAIPTPQSALAEEEQPMPPMAMPDIIPTKDNASQPSAKQPAQPEPMKEAANTLPPPVPPAAPAAPVVTTPPSIPAPAPSPVVAMVPAPVPTPASIAATPVSAKANAATEARLSDLTAKLETLQKTLDKMSQQTNSLTTRMDTVAKTPAPVAPPVKDTALENRMALLEQKLATLSTQSEARAKVAPVEKPAKVEPVPPAPAPVPSVQESKASQPVASADLAAAPIVDTPAATKPVKKARPVAAKTPVVKKVAVAKRAAPVQTWVLRAATPDAAWIAKDATSTALTKIQVGDKVDSIGEVESISQLGDGWIVVGTKGTVH